MARYVYSSDADVLVVRLRDGVLDHGEELAPGIIAHYNKSGELLEIEILDASEIAIEIIKKLTKYSKTQHRETPRHNTG